MSKIAESVDASSRRRQPTGYGLSVPFQVTQPGATDPVEPDGHLRQNEIPISP